MLRIEALSTATPRTNPKRLSHRGDPTRFACGGRGASGETPVKLKRRYKEGDWLRIPLDSHVDALGILARACRSRLFGYFFAIRAGHVPSHDELKLLRHEKAAACSLFGGAPLEELRWSMVATAVPFDREAWPFPHFGSRGAFGRTWTRHAYDPGTMQAVRSEPTDESLARDLPDSRFANAWELETLLRERMCAGAPREPLAVYELRAGFDPAALELLSRGGRVQFSEQLAARDLQILAQFLERHPHVETRVHGFSTRPFDLRSLSAVHSLRALSLEARLLQHVDALTAFKHLQRLRVGPIDHFLPLDVLQALPALRELEVRGRHAGVSAIASCTGLEALGLINTPPVDLSRLACAPVLRELTIAHNAQPLSDMRVFTALARLELRDVALFTLPDLAQNTALATIVMRNITRLRNLAPLARAPALRELEIAGMPQLEVWDFSPLSSRPQLRNLHVEIGSRTKSREVYRLLHVGKTRA